VVIELLLVKVQPDQNAAFEQAFAQAQTIISSMDGYLSHRLQRSVENPGKYALVVHWRRLEDHTVGFRQSQGFQEWKRLLYHFYDGAPAVEHFEELFAGPAAR
jgi:heme-degrading monooxygenase HmoA